MDDDAMDGNSHDAREVDGGRATYEVGYGKPPRHSRFKPGQSGNPKGRRRGSKSTGTLLREILDEKVVVREGSREKKITRHEAWLRQTMNGALKGDAKASATMISLLRDVGQIEPEPVNPNDDARRRLADEDYEIMRRHFPDRIKSDGQG
jgi:hypothetical protein